MFNNIYKQCVFALAICSLLFSAVPVIYAESVELDGFLVTYQGRSYDNSSNETTFSYLVEGTGVDPALSHFTIGFPICDSEVAVVGYSPTNLVSIGPDPTTGVYGIKWDIGMEPDESREYSFTLAGNYGEDIIDVAVKAGRTGEVGEITGPACSGGDDDDESTFNISGYVFMDMDEDNIVDLGEPVFPNVTIALLDDEGNVIATTVTSGDGYYIFENIIIGSYSVAILDDTDVVDFNDILLTYFDPISPLDVDADIVDQDLEINFGFLPNVGDIIDDLDPDDPDDDGITLEGNGKTIGYWKHQLRVAIKGRGRAHIDSDTLLNYLQLIEQLYLPEPFQFDDALPFPDAFSILRLRSRAGVDLLKKQLLGTEFNEVSGMGLSDDYADLQSVLIAWGEYLVANSELFSRAELISAKDIFDSINNTGNN
jgi:hypothetical protein